VPGLGLDDAAWAPTVRALGPDADDRTLVPSLPGYGRRPLPGEDLAPTVLGERLAAALTEPSVLMGHSASCQVVARAAAVAPERVRALVLVGPTTDPSATSWPRLVERWLRTAAWERPGQVPVLTRTYRRTGLLWMRRTMDAARREDVRRDVRSVRCPVLVVRGPHDRICPERWARELVDAAPEGSRAATLGRGGHMVPLTHGGLLAAEVRRFLRPDA
jgi:pimeloyl-ACP methyl ester carboxylesterase